MTLCSSALHCYAETELDARLAEAPGEERRSRGGGRSRLAGRGLCAMSTCSLPSRSGAPPAMLHSRRDVPENAVLNPRSPVCLKVDSAESALTTARNEAFLPLAPDRPGEAQA